MMLMGAAGYLLAVFQILFILYSLFSAIFYRTPLVVVCQWVAVVMELTFQVLAVGPTVTVLSLRRILLERVFLRKVVCPCVKAATVEE